MDRIEAKWLEEMSFEANVDGFNITLDAKKEVGGTDKGPRPKALLLVALAGCTGMDVVSLLKKMRVDIDDLKITIDGNLSKEHPTYYEQIQVTYYFVGQELDKDKIEKAVRLSHERYCGVNYTLRQVGKVSYDIVYAEVPQSKENNSLTHSQ